MDRRRFLSLIGLGGATAGVAARELTTGQPPPPPPSALPEAQVPAPRKGAQRVFWSVETDARAVSLTFDDGPDPRFTPRILEILDRFGVRASFLAMGYNAVIHRSLTREVLAAGHEVGGHGWKHLNLAHVGADETREEIEGAIDRIEQVTQERVTTFRPPYGRFGEDALRILARRRPDLIIWSLTRGDLSWRHPDRVADHIGGEMQPGDIILLHDGIGRGTFHPDAPWTPELVQRREVEIAALPRVISEALDEGVEFTTASGLLKKMRPIEIDA